MFYNLKFIITIFSVSRVFFVALAQLATLFIPLQEGYLGKQIIPHGPYLTWIWANFDGRHFINIATQGYQHTNFAYFPLYPLTISLAGYVLPFSHLYLGIGISLAAFLFALVYVYKIVLLDFSKNIALWTIIFLAIFPLSFFYNAVYTDSLFLALSVASFYFARRNNWLVAGVLGFLAATSRLSGVVLAPALLVEWFLQYKGKNLFTLNNAFSALLAPALTILGTIAYMIYLQVNFGDFLLFQKSMSAWNQEGFVFPLQVIVRYLKIFWSVDPSLLVYWVAVLEFVSVILYFALSYYVSKKVRLTYGIFMFLLLILVPFTGTFAGTPRYLLHLFPAFIALACVTSGKAYARRVVLLFFLIMGFILSALFTRGYFIA